jgi:proteasome accessory factor A
MDRLIADDEIKDAVATPPTDTRAYFRGMCLARFAPDIAAASWDSVIFDLPGHDSLQRVPTMEPLRGTKEHVGALFDRCESATELFRAITAG